MSSTHIPKRTVAVIDGDSDDLSVEDASTGSAHSSYNYTPLPRGDYFRLLELLPGEGDTTLHVNLAHYDLDAFNIPPYKALSYTWGESKYDRLMISGNRVPIDSSLRRKYDIRHPLYCDGKRLLISTNLRDALRRLRHPFLPNKLWVDAVCINQEDDAERSAQIMLMPRIYHHASPVTLWLGEEDDDTAQAFGIIHLLTGCLMEFARLEKSRAAGPPIERDLTQRLHTLGVPLPESGQYGPLMRLFDRPVFRRIWCVQEAAVAGTTMVICGDTDRRPTPYAALSAAIMVLRMAGWQEELQNTYLDGRLALYFPDVVQGIQTGWFQRILDPQKLVSDVRPFEATDPRDKVFALLGLVGDFSHRGLHELFGSRHDDECKDDHAYDCPHWREQTRNWAQTKVEGSGGFESLMYAANTRIYRLVDRLTTFFKAVMDLISFMREHRDAAVAHAGKGGGALSKATEVKKLRMAADELFVDIRHTLDQMTNEFVSSDELAAYHWASKAVEDFCVDYDRLYASYNSGRWSVREVEYIAKMFESLKHLNGLLKDGSDYSPSHSSQESSSYEESQAAEEDQGEELEERGNSPTQSESIEQTGLSINESLRSTDSGSEKENPERSQISPSDHVPKVMEDDNKSLRTTAGQDLKSLVEMQPALHEGATEIDEYQAAAEPSAETAGSNQDITGSGGWDKVIGLEYMAPREPAERPVLTSDPVPPWSPDRTLLPDYSLSTAEVYRNFTVQCLVKTKSLDIFSTIGVRANRHNNTLPSWVPDYSCVPSGAALSLVHSKHPSRSATLLTPTHHPEITWNPAIPEVLKLGGQIVGSLSSVSILRSNPRGLKSVHEEWENMSGISCTTTSVPTKEGIEPTYRDIWKNKMGMPDAVAPGCPPTLKSWSQMIGDLIGWFHPDGEQPEELSEKQWECYFTFLCFLRVQQSGALVAKEIKDILLESGITLDTTAMKSEGGLLKAIETIVVGRRIAYTEEGHVVFVPEMAETGDRICIFKGGKVPFLIRARKKETDQEGYELLGECFGYTLLTNEFGKRLAESWQMIALI